MLPQLQSFTPQLHQASLIKVSPPDTSPPNKRIYCELQQSGACRGCLALHSITVSTGVLVWLWEHTLTEFSRPSSLCALHHARYKLNYISPYSRKTKHRIIADSDARRTKVNKYGRQHSRVSCGVEQVGKRVKPEQGK